MREIKFRGKRLRDGKWTYGWLVIEDNGTAWISRYYHRGEWEQVDPETVGQYTGLKSDSGQEVYEGDVIKTVHHKFDGCKANYYNKTGVIELSKGYQFGYRLKWKRGHMMMTNSQQIRHMNGEIIGNIYEGESDAS